MGTKVPLRHLNMASLVAQPLNSSPSSEGPRSAGGPPDNIQREWEGKSDLLAHISSQEESSILSEPTIRKAANDLARLSPDYNDAASRDCRDDDATQQRLRADTELLLLLQLCEYSGSKWELFRSRLARYGFAIIRSWCLSGRVFHHCRRFGFGALGAPPRPMDPDDAAELASETVARALVYFEHNVLRENRWDPSKGATIRTFFIGACTRCFANEFTRWCRENATLWRLDSCANIGDELPSINVRPDALLHLRQTINRIPSNAVRLAELCALGHTHAEIAKELQITEKAVERRLHKLRANL